VRRSPVLRGAPAAVLLDGEARLFRANPPFVIGFKIRAYRIENDFISKLDAFFSERRPHLRVHVGRRAKLLQCRVDPIRDDLARISAG
jgi:hypothetical protein